MKKLGLFALIALISIIVGFTASYFAFAYFLVDSGEVNNVDVLSSLSNDESGSKKLPADTIAVDESIVKLPIDKECFPDIYKFKWDVEKDTKIIAPFSRDYNINFGSPEEYSDVDGITAFRGNNYRNSASFGFTEVNEGKLEKLWSSNIGFIDIWTGVGWTGQPAIVKWNEKVKKIMNIYPAKKSKKDLKEVIYATLDGNIYFYDLDDGLPTRDPIKVGYPHKGSLSVDPRGYPLLYAGQGIEQVGGKPVPIGFRIYSLIDQKLLYFINGYDPFALRSWAAFDSNCLIDKNTDTLIEYGENGILYSGKLNTRFDINKGSISISPDLIKYRYTHSNAVQLGVENSPSIYKSNIYFADNSGMFQCVDLNTLTPVWARNINDDTDSTSAIEEVSEEEVYLYTACEVDKQGDTGFSFVRKINALTGSLIWEKKYQCLFDSYTNGGTLASPVIGRNQIDNVVIFNIAKTGSKSGGKLVALDKKTGKEVWSRNLRYYCWSSPVDVYSKDGRAYLIVCDSGGFMSLLDAATGKTIDQVSLGANIEGSPAVYNDMVVVGTRGQKIWAVRIK